MSAERETAVTEAFVALANSLVDPFDAVDLLGSLTAHCAKLLDIESAGVLLADPRQMLHVVAASSEATWKLELFQLQREQGPCLDCYRAGTPVTAADLEAERARWPRFVDAALSAGLVSVHAVPMRIHDTILGTLGLFGSRPGALAPEDLTLAQALAHVGSVAIVSSRQLADQTTIAEQLQDALSSRVVLEQAKGLIAQHGNVAVDHAFDALRHYARDRGERLAEVARALVERELLPGTVVAHERTRGGRPGGSSGPG